MLVLRNIEKGIGTYLSQREGQRKRKFNQPRTFLLMRTAQ